MPSISRLKLIGFICVVAAFGPAAQMNAQDIGGTTTSTGETIIDKIESASNGAVKITIPETVLERLLTPMAKKEVQPGLHPGVNRMSGYRIQVFSDGRNQHSLEARAKARGNAIVARFPKYGGQVYSFSKSPNWYTRVGNFRTIAEATEALAELKRAFPSFASEMRAVKCQIVLVK